MGHGKSDDDAHMLCCWPQTPHNASGSPSYFFYSVNAGPTHNIQLSNYVDYM